jgi:hypothetical protein
MCRARQPVTRNSLKSDMASGPVEIDPLYLFLSAVECSKRGSGEAALTRAKHRSRRSGLGFQNQPGFSVFRVGGVLAPGTQESFAWAAG